LATTTDDSDSGDLRAALGVIDGVDRVIIDEAERHVVLVLRASVDAQQIEAAARAMLDSTEHVLLAVFRPEHRDRQRVRFVDLRRDSLRDRQVSFTVTLEWAGNDYTGTAVGEKGEAIELRTVALAALNSVAALAPPDLQVRLAGIKQVRAFDAELVVVSLYRPDQEPHNLVGAVVSGDDARRAAAVAVLSALNRLLGNYLVT
jgi:hypothetical protein